jgi:hypothetical protein
MSDRAIPAFESALRACAAIKAESGTSQSPVIWLDAFCVPAQDPARDTCLKNMGAIYGNALQVVVVLPTSCFALLDQIRRMDRVDVPALLAFEHDDWVERAWTYQEIVNSKNIYFVSEGDNAVPVRGDKLLNSVGQALEEYKKTRGYDAFRLRAEHPRLSSIEDVIADWLTADYLQRSAYQVMAAMDGRRAREADDFFYAMIGAITTSPVDDRGTASVPPAEYFMRVCETKGDYSFIYSTAPRSTIAGRCWRPGAGPLHTILPWHSSGERQSGSLYPSYLQLNNMCRMVPGMIGLTAKQFVEKFLHVENDAPRSESIQELILRRLQDAGFGGCGEHLELESGYFFPHESLTDLGGVVVVVATEVQWVFGAPGLLLRGNDTDIYTYCGVGVFVGPIPCVGQSINIG